MLGRVLCLRGSEQLDLLNDAYTVLDIIYVHILKILKNIFVYKRAIKKVNKYQGGPGALLLLDVNFNNILRTHFFVQKFIQSQTLSREKLLKRLSYEKFAHKMLMKLTKGISGNAWFEQFLATYTIYILLQTGYDLLTVCFS